MTTFQALIDAFLSAITHLLPVSQALPEALNSNVLQWPVAGNELGLLVVLMGSIAFLYFFRFDWLGMISALIKSIANPLSLKPLNRNLDQHTLLFLILIFVPQFILRKCLSPLFAEHEILTHQLLMAILLGILAFGFQFSYRWNKRINGLNHLKLLDGVTIAAITLLSVHPAFPYIGMLWIGFALKNYHTEAIFKYSMLALGLSLVSETISDLNTIGLKNALAQVGHLNSVAVFVVSFTFFWLGLENLEKNLNEGTYKSFKWISIGSGLFFIVLYFLRN